MNKDLRNWFMVFFLLISTGALSQNYTRDAGMRIGDYFTLTYRQYLNNDQAVGTSLLIIALKSLIGFTGDLGTGLEIDYRFMLFFSAFAMVGILAGSYLSRFIPNEKLKPAFGWFVMVMAVYILVKEILL